jgi:hypothetical protein
MAQFRGRDNTRETFTGAGSTTITLGGAAQNSRSFSGAGYAAGDTFWGTARGGAEICVGLFTYNTTTVAQTSPKYSSNGNAAVSFSSGNACEVFNDIPAYVAELLNLVEISVASAATCDIGGTAVEGAKVVISGTTTITSLGTGADKLRFVRFSGILTLTHNGTSLILPGAANITTAAGDTAVFSSDSSGNWTCRSYTFGALAPFDRRAPGAIGGTTPAAGAFTTLSATGVVTGSAGAVGAPSFTGGAGTNNGLWFPSSTTMALSGNGAEAFRISNGGQGRASAFMAQWTCAGNAICFKGNGTSGSLGALDFSDSALTQCGAINMDQGAHTVTYATSSDDIGKPFRFELEAQEAWRVVIGTTIYDHDDERNLIKGVGPVAQELYHVLPRAVIPGGSDERLDPKKMELAADLAALPAEVEIASEGEEKSPAQLDYEAAVVAIETKWECRSKRRRNLPCTNSGWSTSPKQFRI